MEFVETIIHDQDLPMHLWAEAARTIVYVQNRTSHSYLGFKTLEEMYTRKKPEVIHLVVQYMYVFQKKREPIWILLERREYLLDTMNYPKPLGYTL